MGFPFIEKIEYLTRKMINNKVDSLHMGIGIINRFAEGLFTRCVLKNGDWIQYEITWIFKYILLPINGTDLAESVNQIILKKKKVTEFSGIYKHKKIFIQYTMKYLIRAAIKVVSVRGKSCIYIFIQFCFLIMFVLGILASNDNKVQVLIDNISMYDYCRRKIVNLLQLGLSDLYKPFLGRLCLAAFWKYVDHCIMYGQSFAMYNTIGSERVIYTHKMRERCNNNNKNFYLFANKSDILRRKSSIIKNWKKKDDIENVPMWSSQYECEISAEINKMPPKDKLIWNHINQQNFSNGYGALLVKWLNDEWVETV